MLSSLATFTLKREVLLRFALISALIPLLAAEPKTEVKTRLASVATYQALVSTWEGYFSNDLPVFPQRQAITGLFFWTSDHPEFYLGYCSRTLRICSVYDGFESVEGGNSYPMQRGESEQQALQRIYRERHPEVSNSLPTRATTGQPGAILFAQPASEWVTWRGTVTFPALPVLPTRSDPALRRAVATEIQPYEKRACAITIPRVPANARSAPVLVECPGRHPHIYSLLAADTYFYANTSSFMSNPSIVRAARRLVLRHVDTVVSGKKR